MILQPVHFMRMNNAGCCGGISFFISNHISTSLYCLILHPPTQAFSINTAVLLRVYTSRSKRQNEGEGMIPYMLNDLFCCFFKFLRRHVSHPITKRHIWEANGRRENFGCKMRTTEMIPV